MSIAGSPLIVTPSRVPAAIPLTVIDPVAA
jgi:hypothetical protein